MATWEEMMADDKENAKSELKFCRLCGKNRLAEMINPIQLAVIGRAALFYDGCDSCAVVIHNMMQIVGETIEKKRQEIIQAKYRKEQDHCP